MTRENCKVILGLAEIRTVKVIVRFQDGSEDDKTLTLAEGGSLAILILEDNPHQLPGGAFYDIKP